MWSTDGANLDYINISSSLSAPTFSLAFTGGSGTGLYNPYQPAIDGSGNVWIPSSGTTSTVGSAGVAEFATNGTAGTATLLSPTGASAEGFGNDVAVYLGTPKGIALDNSGNIWFQTTAGSYLYSVIGIAAPTRVPLATMYGNIGTKP
jgi:hypothetical protein